MIRRDLALAFRTGGGGALGVAFFVITAVLVPFGVGPKPELLAVIAPGMLWIAALLACMLTLDRLFQADVEDGSMDLLALSPMPLEVLVLAKCIAHWLTTGLPLLIATPLMALTLNMPSEAYGPMLLGLAIGTPALSLIGAIGASLTAGMRRGGVLTAVLVLPLYIPTLILGALAGNAAASALPSQPYLLLSGAITLACLPLCPLVAAAGLRLALR
ncbi:UNVERIFIED_CONTAM: hypothetical protein GTU68_051629 [Idotea baltica]|nr:hypothetical protein [Idotea baltica]